METRIRILTADPNREFCRQLAELMSAEGDMEVVGAAADGMEALERAQELQPDLILLELVLPKLDGLEVLRRLRDRGVTNGVDGIMIINTADYRCTFKLDQQYDMCYELAIDIRSQEFLTQFYNLFAVYRTENMDDYRIMSFGNEKLRVTETPSTTSKYRSFKFTIE